MSLQKPPEELLAGGRQEVFERCFPLGLDLQRVLCRPNKTTSVHFCVRTTGDHHMWPVLTTLLVALAAAMADSVTWSSACAPAGSGWRALQLRAGRQPDCLAWASFSDTIETIGWANLIVETNSAFDDQSQAYAAGWIEAALTRERIYQVCALGSQSKWKMSCVCFRTECVFSLVERA